MKEKKQKIVSLVIEHNVSAIVTLSEKLEVDQETVIELINELISEKKLQGTITEDGTRFFRSDAKVSDAPVIPRDDELPQFLSYNTRPGYAIAIIGFLVLIGGAIVNAYATVIEESNFAAVLLLVGAVILFAGLYLVAKRKTPE
ncbi:MAG: hypothetical protein RTV72_00785 [Candidatus Thorarchaeota archaeon]